MKKIYLAFTALLFTSLAYGQSSMIGVDLQVYPTGVIPGISYDHPVSVKDYVHARLGYQIIDHRDLGVQEDEKGSGFGGSLGYKRYFNETQDKWSLMGKVDLWQNKIDWEKLSTPTAMGTSNVTVVQPTAQLGYGFSAGNMVITPSVAFGFEWNVKTDGEPTGEGAILLVGVNASWKL